MNDIAIYGAGGLGREIQMLIEQINLSKNTWSFRGFFDDAYEKGDIINGAKIMGGIQDVNSHEKKLSLVLAFGKPETKKYISEIITNSNITYPVLVHPHAQIGNHEYVTIGEGTVLTAGTIVAVNVEIGRHVLVNFGSIIGHDVKIGDYTSIMPSVNVNGEVTVHEGVYLGVHSTLINQIEIGKNTTIGAGSVVFNSIRENCMAIGMPAVSVSSRK